jgi:hypothetical protein
VALGSSLRAQLLQHFRRWHDIALVGSGHPGFELGDLCLGQVERLVAVRRQDNYVRALVDRGDRSARRRSASRGIATARVERGSCTTPGSIRAMTYRVRVIPEAEREAEAAADWYEQRRPGLGAEFIAELVVVLDGLIASSSATSR